jgi:hypothetical protein
MLARRTHSAILFDGLWVAQPRLMVQVLGPGSAHGPAERAERKHEAPEREHHQAEPDRADDADRHRPEGDGDQQERWDRQHDEEHEQE